MSYIKIMLARDLSQLNNAFRCSRDEIFRMMNPICTKNPYSWCPQTDVFETAAEIEFIMELAGVKLEDISVETDQRTLRIFGIRRKRQRRPDGTYLLAEIPAGYFERFFPLSAPIDPNAVEASYAEGLLHIRLKKLPLNKIHNITVRST